MDYAYKPTTHGRAVMAACMALEKPFRITRTVFGAGKVDENVNLADIHELLEFVSEGAVSERRHENDRLYLTLQFANSEHPKVKTFLLSEFIVYVEDPETGEETDLLYGTLGDYRQPVPAYNPAFPPSVFNFPLTLILSDEVNVTVSAPAGLVTHGELAGLIDAMAVRRVALTIPAAGWTRDGVGRYPCRQDIQASGVTDRLLPTLTILPDGEAEAAICGMAPYIQTLDGVVRVFAASEPDSDIPAVLTLQGDASGYCTVDTGGGTYTLPPATATTLGGVMVKPGSGLRIDGRGNISLDTADGGEVSELFSGSKADKGQE